MPTARKLQEIRDEDLNRYAWWTPREGHDGESGVVDQVKIRVRIHDVRQHFGRVDYLIGPADGLGRKWISQKNIDFVPQRA